MELSFYLISMDIATTRKWICCGLENEGKMRELRWTPKNLKELKILKLTLVIKIQILSLLYLKEGKHSP
jgi:hypothetical protein